MSWNCRVTHTLAELMPSTFVTASTSFLSRTESPVIQQLPRTFEIVLFQDFAVGIDVLFGVLHGEHD